jgi:hypothetical protein
MGLSHNYQPSGPMGGAPNSHFKITAMGSFWVWARSRVREGLEPRRSPVLTRTMRIDTRPAPNRNQPS